MLSSSNQSTNQPINQSTTQPINSPLITIADTTLILSHRCSEWCGHGPILEQDIAISNIALDYLGQARNWYQLTAQLINQQNTTNHCTEDSLAYLRNATEYKNLIITELPNQNWAVTITRIFIVSVWLQAVYKQLTEIGNQPIEAIAAKAIKEVQYHVKWSADWVLRLGDGTEESKLKIQEAITYIWPYVGELFTNQNIAHLGIKMPVIQKHWQEKVQAIFEEATLQMPAIQYNNLFTQHTEHLGYLLAEMQYLQRTYPNATW